MLVSETGPEKLRFKPRARIIRTIGDQLISGPEAAVIELVKNAYDADARRVVVTFLPPLEQGYGRITVSDDGHGMTLGDIQDKWMEPATTSKLYGRVSPSLGRVMMGSKGIGRFAAAKLGGHLGLISITDREGARRAVLIPQIDWSSFNGDAYLSDIAIDYFTEDTDQPTGTLLEITQLNESWSEAKIRRLLLELRKLISPLRDNEADGSFSIFLDVSSCTVENSGFDGALMMGVTGDSSTDGSGSPDSRYQVQPVPLMTACDYEVTGEFTDSGQFRGTFENKRAGTGSEFLELFVPLQPDEDSCGPVGIRLFLFDREAEAIKANLKNAGLGEMTAVKARQLLDSITGVAIYREGFRVRPYGDPDNDWLTLDRERVNDPSLRIGHNQVAGYVAVADRDISHLEERSSREGFESNGAFRRLTRLIRELLTREVEPRRYQFRQRAGLSRSRNSSFDDVRKLGELSSVKKITDSLPEAERVKAVQIINQQSHLISERIDLLEERQRRLEANSALGAIIAEIIHEGIQPAAYTATTSNRLKRLFPDMLLIRGNRFEHAKGEFEKKLPLLAAAGSKLVDLFENLEPLTAGRRSEPDLFNVVNIIKGAMSLFENSGVPMIIMNPAEISDVFGHAGDLQTALVNLFKNAIHWLRDAQTPDPKITVTLSADGNSVIAAVEDNGPGIRAEFADSIFDVGFSLRTRGTGLGLNIAREALARSKAMLELDTDHRPGTRFVITFPRKKGN